MSFLLLTSDREMGILETNGKKCRRTDCTRKKRYEQRKKVKDYFNHAFSDEIECSRLQGKKFGKRNELYLLYSLLKARVHRKVRSYFNNEEHSQSEDFTYERVTKENLNIYTNFL